MSIQVICLVTMAILGWMAGVVSVMLGARIVDRFSRGQSALTGRFQDRQSLPFIIKDEKTEHALEQEALGYPVMDKFDSVDGLGR